MDRLTQRLAEGLGTEVVRITALGGGCIGDVRHAILADGREIVAKQGRGLVLEARMLRYLKTHTTVPVPTVLWENDNLLVMDYIPAGGAMSAAAETDASEKIAALHTIRAPQFGFAWDTVIGGLHQPNPQSASWRDFFRDHRLLYMGREALKAGRLPSAVMARLERLAANLERWISATSQPSLVHGDLWGGNVLIQGGTLVGVIDPAIYFADAEIELAFTTLFNTFGESFFDHYHAIRPIAPGFFEERRDLYNLYPLLVHVRLFGGSYVNDVERTLRRFGF